MPINIDNAVDKAYEGKSLTEIANSPVACLQGLSERQATLLKEAFGTSTVRDLANLRFVRWAQAITVLADTEKV